MYTTPTPDPADADNHASGSDNRDRPLLSVRTTLVLMLAGLSAGGVLLLLLYAQRSPVEIALATLGTGAAATRLFHWLIA
jgi:hypothetical protein